MVTALASHRCGPGSIPGPGVTCGLSLLLVLVRAPRVFLRVLRFSSLHKNQHSKFQFDLETMNKEPPRGSATAKLLLLLIITIISHNQFCLDNSWITPQYPKFEIFFSTSGLKLQETGFDIKDKIDTEWLHCLQCRQNTKLKKRNKKYVIFRQKSMPSSA